MLQSSRSLTRHKFRRELTSRCLSQLALPQRSRAAYRRIWSFTNHERICGDNHPIPHLPSSLASPSLTHLLRSSFSTSTSTRAISFRDLKSEEKPKAPPKPKPEETSERSKTEEELDPAELAYQQATKKSREKARQEWERQRAQEETEKEKQEEDGSESKEKKREEKAQEEAAPSPHGNKSPWQVFTETLQTEFKASKEWNESTKQLASSANAFTQNESIKKAREAYTSASGAATSGTAAAFKTTGKAIGQGAAWTWDSTVVRGLRDGVNATGRGIDKATKPIRDTQAFKSVQNVVDDGSSTRYGGWIDKEERRKRREQREQEQATGVTADGKPVEKIEEDPNAGTKVTLHKDSILHSKWREFRDGNPMMQSLFSLKSSYAESENPLISTARSITDRVAGFFAENETAMVIKKFKEMDPNFSIEPFLKDMREYILPEVLDAYVKGDQETLKLWLSAPQFQVYAALAQQYLTAGLKSDGRVLDIRNVDILSARRLEPGEIPVFIITCRTQEVHVYRNSKTSELAAGMEDKVQQVTYAIGVTRVPEDVHNPDTRGWRLIELQKSARDYI